MPSLRLDTARLFSVLAAAVARSRLPYFVETGSRDYGSEVLVTTGGGEPVIVMELRNLAGPPRLAVDRATVWLPRVSVLDLVLIPRDELAARHFKRCPPGHWREIDLAGPHAVLRLTALQTEIPLISLFG